MFTQKKNGNHITFDFYDEYFLYSISDSDQTSSLKISYLSIDLDRLDRLTEKNDWFRNVGIIWLIIGIYSYMMSGVTGIWLVLGIGMLVVYSMRITHFSVLYSDEGKIFIIQDKQENEILEKIRGEKRKILREKLYFFNPNNSPETELEKYTYLKEQGAINQEEFTQMSEDLLSKHGIKKV